MAKYDVNTPDGKVYTVNAPEGATEADAIRYVQENFYKADTPSLGASVKQGLGNLAAGAVRGAGSIGATIMTPVDAAARALGVQNDFIGRTDRRAAMDEALQGMGAETDSLAYGAGKLGAEIAGTAGMGGMLAKPLQALAASRYGAGIEPLLSGAARALQTGGFRVGELAGTGAGTAARALGGGAVGAGSAGLVNPEDAGMGALVGGALPMAARVAGLTGRGIRQAVSGGGASPEVARLAERAQELGINIPADRLVNSRPLNAVAAGLNYVPFSGRAATEDAMTTSLNRALSNTFGQDSSNVTQALRRAETTLGGQFDNVLQNNAVQIDRQFLNDLADVGTTASRELGSDALRPIANQIDEIIAKGANGQIDGQAAYNIKRTLDRLGRGNGPEAFHANELRGALMDALNRSIGPEAAAQFAQTRQQYGAMLSLQKLAKAGAEGEISVARLANMRNIRNPQMQELADIAAQFVKPREGQHGAAQRAVVGAVGATTAGIPGLLGGIAAGRGANMLLNSQAARNLLTRSPTMLGEPETLGLLTQGAYRAAPLLLPE